MVDIDSDGYKDIEILDFDASNKQYKYYRWNPLEEKFESHPFFSLFCSSYVVIPETRQLLVTVANGIYPYIRELYELTDTKNGGWLGSYEY
ncbi:MAG: hypothetical protein LBR98_02360 [Syntrophomonadaceae bacterium]|nr:hypothetical protein [Syntrophomonadaceae bacterium]